MVATITVVSPTSDPAVFVAGSLLPVTVQVLNDGVPLRNASVNFFAAGSSRPVISRLTDSNGNATWNYDTSVYGAAFTYSATFTGIIYCNAWPNCPVTYNVVSTPWRNAVAGNPSGCTNPVGNDQDQACIDGYMNVCSGQAHQWVPTMQTCGQPLPCSNPDGADGSQACINGFINNCQNGSWIPGSTPCGGCSNPAGNQGDQQCLNGFINTCQGGAWIPGSTPCGGGGCSNPVGVEGDVQYQSCMGGKVVVKSRCTGGVWVDTGNACPNPTQDNSWIIPIALAGAIAVGLFFAIK